MKRLLLDTNIYGEMVVDRALEKIREGIVNNNSLIIFGSNVVRSELRATPKKIKVEGSNLRIDLLNLYDYIVCERVVNITQDAEELAQHYYETYRKLGGAKGKSELKNDFLIVASASFKSMDIVVSDDEASMKAEHSLQAYSLVNSVKKLSNPNFINYKKFKELLR